MGGRRHALLSSLGLRLLVPLFLVVAGVLAVHALVNFRSTQSHFRELVGGEAYRASGLIRRATHDGMLLNRLEDVQAVLERLGDGPEVHAVRVYDKEGRVVLSSGRSDIGVRAELDEAPCAECHLGGSLSTPAATEARGVIRASEGDVVRQLTLLENEPACSASGCHAGSAQDAVLGVLDVEMSMRPLDTALAASRRQLVWTTLALMLVMGAVAWLIVHYLIHRPIRRLREGARRVAEGNLETRIEVRGRHELADLARDFNQMAADLGASQRQLTEWSNRLEEKVEEKTSALRAAQRQVLHMEKMASLGKLSATVAHELNNPISGMLTYARLVERELAEQPLEPEVSGELNRYLHLVQQECSRCGQIVQNLLVFARRSGTEMERVDVDEIVQRSLMLVRHHLEMRNIDLRSDTAVADPWIVADPGQLQQAVVALLVNAVEAMAGGGRLDVSLQGDGDGVMIAISDTGSGIPADVLPQIFEPFFSTKESERGVGLGLAVVYGIVHRHGGSIEVASTEGEGTTFRVRLPRDCAAAAAQVETEAFPVVTEDLDAIALAEAP